MNKLAALQSAEDELNRNGISHEMFLGDPDICDFLEPDGIRLTLVTSRDSRIYFDEKNSAAQEVFAELTVLTAHSFGMELDETSSDGTLHHLQDHDVLVMLHDEKGIAGFASGFFSKDGLFYLHGIAIAPRAKGRGAARRMVRIMLNVSGTAGITFTTQNPVMFCLLRSICTATYPASEHGIPAHLHKQVISLMQGRNGTLDPFTGIVHNLYGRCLYPQLPESRDPAVNEWFAKALNVSAGQTRNAFVFVGQGSK